MSRESDVSRRKFLQVTGAAAGAAALGGSLLSMAASGAQAADAPHNMAHSAPAAEGSTAVRGRMFFTNELDFATLSQAAERIFPKDENGPGAIDLFVPHFIDNQLAGAFGYNAREYNSGPFAPGAPTQGSQTALLRRDLFLQGLAALNTQANASFQKNFPDLDDTQKDQILKLCEAGSIPTQGFTSAFFFGLLKATVLAGVYADPIYNGNSAMLGWKMKDYPGAQMVYLGIVDSAAFVRLPPVSLAGM